MLFKCGLLLIVFLSSALSSINVPPSHIISMQADDDQKIISGTESECHYPYMVSLQILVNERNFWGFLTGRKIWAHNCGGSIVNDKCIVTAAHCVDRIPAGLLSIVAGTNNLSDGSGQRYYLKKYIIHENYVELNGSDIAVLLLNDSMKFSDKVDNLTLSEKFTDGDVILFLTGWGYTNPVRVGGTPDTLREASLKSITTERCNEKGMPAGKTEICTYGGPLKGACGGDSGGPLVCRDGNNVILVGIVSLGTRVCAIGRPDVFTRASAFHDWIKEKCS